MKSPPHVGIGTGGSPNEERSAAQCRVHAKKKEELPGKIIICHSRSGVLC